MRAYQPKQDLQKKSYYSDRFYVTPELPKLDPSSDSVLMQDYLSLKNKVEVAKAHIQLGHLVIYINAQDNFVAVKHLKEIRAYDFLMELTAVDYLADKGHFEVVYELLSTSKHRRIRLKCIVKQGQAVESLNPLFRMADFSEREMYDMYGIVANNHPFMKRILMPDDWQGHPLLKSYPMVGDEAAAWYEVDKIFGKEARDTIGPEQRDCAVVDRYDTQRFARLGHEVPYGADISQGEPHTAIQYQETEGIKIVGKPLVTPFEDIESEVLKERK
jgi:NADH-quinone oxidoreductase subunit C